MSQRSPTPALDLTQLRSEHEPGLRSFLCSRVQDADLEDILQELWVRVSEGKFPGGHIRGWLFQVAKNLVADRHRKKMHQPVSETLTKSESDPLRELLEQERSDAVRHCFEKLAPESKALVQARLSGESGEALSEQFGILPTTIYTRYSRAIEQVRECVERRGYETGDRKPPRK